MDRPHEFIQLQTLVKEEVRIDPETGEEYSEEIMIAENKKLRITLDLFDINSFEEYTNNDGTVYGKRSVISVAGENKIVATSYDDMKKLLEDLNGNEKVIGFGRIQEEKKSSKAGHKA